MAITYFDFVLNFFYSSHAIYESYSILVELSKKSPLQHRSADLQKSYQPVQPILFIQHHK